MALAWAAALVVSGCGGGGGGATTSPAAATGGGGGTTGGTGNGDTNSGGGAPSTPQARVELQGTVSFEAVPTLADGGLDYAAQTRKPVRMVAIEAVDIGGKILASGRTDGAGHYALSVPSPGSVKLRVLARMFQDASAMAAPSAEVADNTEGDQVYAAVQELFLIGSGALKHDLVIPSGWLADGTTSVDTERVAAPFAILDTIQTSQSKVLQAAPATVFPLLTVLWSEKNTPALPVNLAAGAIGTTHTRMVAGLPVMVLLGKKGVDTDEYDASVISHEWAHYFQRTASRDDSPGGSHFSRDLLDRNLAFSEGWATAWSGIALDSGRYTDSQGDSASSSIVMDLTTPPAANKGWFNENSLWYVLRKLHDSDGLAPIVDAFKGSFRSVVASTGIHSFQASLAQVAPKAAANLAPLLESQSISSAVDDAWAVRETNNGGSAYALPMYGQLAIGTPLQNLCVSNSLDPHSEGNKLGQIRYLRFSVTEPRFYQVQVTGPIDSDPDFSITNAKGTVVRGVTDSPAYQSASAQLDAGDYLMAVRDYRHSSADTCFTVSIQ
ncbi:hypothetical protein GT347_26625 [Xylophilus rhododendri]|uniref:Uncharacterized protein n=1 Tax=Xylophilus rhododendri TaxID=2697032 RepID=A0A857JB56_9BURK|nr:hypothetical protein [Xylophilus rhododendri]QHJ01251.1 hypothetical protein GT347_26625 [Xylophilus rhododendri]